MAEETAGVDLTSPFAIARRELGELIKSLTGLPFNRACDVLEILKQVVGKYVETGEPVLLTERQIRRVGWVLEQVFTEERWETDAQFRAWVSEVFCGRIVLALIPIGNGPAHQIRLSVVPT